MKKLTNVFVVSFLLFFPSCLKCGEDVFLGSFDLMPESVDDWIPYGGFQNLTYVNQAGDSLTMELQERRNSYEEKTFRILCSRGYDDIAAELYRAQTLDVQFSHKTDTSFYNLHFHLFVDHVENTDDLKLFDNFYCNAFVSDWTETNMVMGYVQLVANPRGNSFSTADLRSIKNMYTSHAVTFSESMQLNDSIYDNIYYNTHSGVPSVFVQQGRGVIAFRGLNDDIWVLQ